MMNRPSRDAIARRELLHKENDGVPPAFVTTRPRAAAQSLEGPPQPLPAGLSPRRARLSTRPGKPPRQPPAKAKAAEEVPAGIVSERRKGIMRALRIFAPR